MFFVLKFLFFCTSFFCIVFATEKAPISYLELISGQGPKPVALGHPYNEITIAEKDNSIFLKECNYAILNQGQDDNKCAIVGPLLPSVLCVLTIGTTTYVAHIACISDFEHWLNDIKNSTQEYDSSKITGELFTNKSPIYRQKYFFEKNKPCSFYDLYGRREQVEVIRDYKNLILNVFNIPNRDQITGLIFKPKEIHNQYTLAELYVKVRLSPKGGPIINNTCIMKEKYFGDFSALPPKIQVEYTQSICNTMANPANITSLFNGPVKMVYIPFKSE